MKEEEKAVIELFDLASPERPTVEEVYEHRIRGLQSFNKMLKIFVLILLLLFMVFGLGVIPWVVQVGEEDLVAREQTACDVRVEEETGRTYSKVCSGEKKCPTRELPP